jgi:hypothetical protein
MYHQSFIQTNSAFTTYSGEQNKMGAFTGSSAFTTYLGEQNGMGAFLGGSAG